MSLIRQKNLVEVCPQCCKSVDSSENRLVRDTCGHSKCRICLLQEITGCMLCVAKTKPTERSDFQGDSLTGLNSTQNSEPQQRKSVITSLAIQIAEQQQVDDTKPLSLSIQSVDKDTCHLIKHSLQKDILFPTDIVKRSTGNFYHLKRVFSQRFFNENNNKKHKACEAKEKWGVGKDSNKKVQTTAEEPEDENSEKRSWRLPNHVQVQYYCTVHKVTIPEKNGILRHHMTCGSDSDKPEPLLFQCKICDKSYKVIGKLNRHMKVHTKNSKFKCGNCGKSCTDNYALRAHERAHTHQKPYACRYCDRKFSGLQNFKRHEKKHRDEKKFVCNECGFQFITKTELKRHGVTHTKMKSFTCSICSSKFTFKRTLMRHLRTHDANLTRIKCPHCESTFKRKDNLERHVKLAHLEQKTIKTESTQEGENGDEDK